jgi:hypothetical protein
MPVLPRLRTYGPGGKAGEADNTEPDGAIDALEATGAGGGAILSVAAMCE